MGDGARTGRDKLTLVVPDALDAVRPLGRTADRRKHRQARAGIVPIAGEQLADPSRYGGDRLLRADARSHDATGEANGRRAIDALKAAQAPVAEIDLPEPSALGAEFVRWEIATAVAGAILEINPFDQPNVQQAKDGNERAADSNTRRSGTLPAEPADAHTRRRDRADADAGGSRGLERRQLGVAALAAARRRLLRAARLPWSRSRARPGTRSDCGARSAIATRAATMFGYGPRYLHSTGQLHKGGPNSGVFVLISATPTEDLPIPGEPFSFGTLEHAQALGDFASLGRGRPPRASTCVCRRPIPRCFAPPRTRCSRQFRLGH